MTLSDLTSALASYGIGSPHLFSSTDTEALLSATYYHPRRHNQRWVFQARRRDGGGIQIVPLHPLTNQ